MRNGKFFGFMESTNPMILCLNETKLHDEWLVREKIKERLARWFPIDLQFWNCSKTMKGSVFGYAGTAILINRSFTGGNPIKV